jgi:alanine dehydrogenase
MIIGMPKEIKDSENRVALAHRLRDAAWSTVAP